MTPAEIRAAGATAFAQFQVDSKLRTEQITDADRMMFQAAFTIGANWATTRAIEQARRIGARLEA